MKGERVARIYVALDKSMTDEEIVQSLKDAAAKHNAEKKASEEADRAEETTVDGESDE
jgi:hypothetical protein